MKTYHDHVNSIGMTASRQQDYSSRAFKYLVEFDPSCDATLVKGVAGCYARARYSMGLREADYDC